MYAREVKDIYTVVELDGFVLRQLDSLSHLNHTELMDTGKDTHKNTSR